MVATGEAPHAVSPKQGNGLAVAGMVLGILGLVLCWLAIVGWILALLGIILGAVGLSKSTKVGSGQGMGIAGLVCGVLGVVAGVAFFLLIPRGVSSYMENSLVSSKLELTKVQVDHFAHDYYVQWAVQVDKGCADVTILEIAKTVDHTMTEQDIKDPWGHPLQLMCESSKLKGVYSWGENGTDDKGLGDDINSWERVRH